jgi:hypothetical protein
MYDAILSLAMMAAPAGLDSHLLRGGGCTSTQATAQAGGCSGRVATYSGGCTGKAAPQANGCHGALARVSRTRTVTRERPRRSPSAPWRWHQCPPWLFLSSP